ncbi:alkyl/aryl-sulfatase [Paraglaciecola chathamensis]|nr:alkyl/aryl-sulfatase [Paraglaciecola oceanifecundans]
MIVRNHFIFSSLSKAISLALLITANSHALAEAPSSATKQLTARSAEFNQDIIQVSKHVYTAVGYGVSPISMIIGDDGIVIIDTGISVQESAKVREAFRAITPKPVKAIIYTHGHGDHTTGALAFKDNDDVQVWAREEFGHEDNFAKKAGLTIQRKRGAAQAGFILTPEERINNGVAKAFWPSKGGKAFGTDTKVKVTHTFSDDSHLLNIAGLELTLAAAPGETADELFIWYGDEKVIFAGDNFYKSWPNLYPIRGAGYRDVRLWADSLSKMLEYKPASLVGGHTRPIIGQSEVTEVLTNYRDAIQFVFDKTIEGMNKGLTPNELVEYVNLPEKYQNLDYLQPYYGHPEWAIRSIFNGYLGWYDGNPTNLFPLSDKEEAQKIADLAGGSEKLMAEAEKSLTSNPQWSAQLCDHLLALDGKNKSALLTKAKAMRLLAKDLLTATGRNYYLSVAKQLEKKAGL